MSNQSLTLHYDIDAADFSAAGEASSGVKRTLNKIGVNPAIVKRVAIAMYEAEINAIIHAGGGEADIEITPEKITVKISDHGPGIPDIAQAMTAGWSTAPESLMWKKPCSRDTLPLRRKFVLLASAPEWDFQTCSVIRTICRLKAPSERVPS